MRTLPQHTVRGQLKSSEELSAVLEHVLALARRQGASDAAVSVNHDIGFSVDVRMQQVETVAFSEDNGVSVTVYQGHQKGSASSSDTSKEALESMVLAAMDIARVSAADPCFGLADKALMAKESLNLDLYHPWSITPEEAIALALRCEQQAHALDKRIDNSDGIHVSSYAFCQGYANSHGFLGMTQSTRHGLSCSLIAKENGVMQRDYDYTTARYAGDLRSTDDLAQEAVTRTVSRLGARKIKTQKMPVVFSSRLSSGLFSSFIAAISGSNLYRKNSFLLDSIGQMCFPKGIRIYDAPHLLRGLGSAPFDAEGVATRNNVWVDDGVIQQYVLSSYSARKLGLPTSGNSGGVFNLTVDATAGDLSDVLRQMGTGLLVTELMGQGVNILTGDYSRGAAGFWVENGEIQFPVEEITIAGRLQDMFAAMRAVGSDVNPNTSTRCGSVLIDNMMIAGQ